MKDEKKKSIRVLLVDDHPRVREGVQSCLIEHVRFEIVGKASHKLAAIAKSHDPAPDVILQHRQMIMNKPAIHKAAELVNFAIGQGFAESKGGPQLSRSAPRLTRPSSIPNT